MSLTADDVRAIMRAESKAAGSQAAFAEQCDAPLSTINAIISGRRRPTPAVLERLGLRCRVTVEYVIAGRDQAA